MKCQAWIVTLTQPPQIRTRALYIVQVSHANHPRQIAELNFITTQKYYKSLSPAYNAHDLRRCPGHIRPKLMADNGQIYIQYTCDTCRLADFEGLPTVSDVEADLAHMIDRFPDRYSRDE